MKNREIKFRVWTGTQMEYKVMAGFLGAFYVQGMDEKDAACMSQFNTKYFDTISVMQFTGLKDKNGKDIYEGDRVLMKKGFDGIVKYHFQRAGFLIEYQQPPFRANYVAEFNVTYGDGETYMDETLEIIGNIHEGGAVKAVAP